MSNRLVRLSIFSAIAAGISGVALAQTCPTPGYMLQDGSCYAAPTPGAIAGAAAGFNDRNRAALPAVRSGVVEPRTSPEALGSTVVLRGSRAANADASQPIPGASGEISGSTDNAPTGALCPIGWDCGHETVGFDRSGLDP